MHCLIEMNKWNNSAGNALTKAIIMVSNSVKNSLQGTPNEFTPEELLQVRYSSFGLSQHPLSPYVTTHQEQHVDP